MRSQRETIESRATRPIVANTHTKFSFLLRRQTETLLFLGRLTRFDAFAFSIGLLAGLLLIFGQCSILCTDEDDSRWLVVHQSCHAASDKHCARLGFDAESLQHAISVVDLEDASSDVRFLAEGEAVRFIVQRIKEMIDSPCINERRRC